MNAKNVLKKNSLYRERVISPANGLINFCSNDYLGVSRHPLVLQAFSDGAKKYGLGSGSSALVCGYHREHAELEEQFAAFLRRDRAILFNSGYHANIGVITALANRHWRIFMDRLNHASIVDAVLLSRAKFRRYAHNDTSDLRRHLSQQQNQPSMIITEGVFSMEGDVAPVVELAAIAEKSRSILMIDDAHGIGVLGRSGGGICEYASLRQIQAPVLIAPLGKAFGSLGAIVAGSGELIESLVQFSRTYRYTTALPPAVACATLQALKIIIEESWRRNRLNELIAFFINQASKRNLPGVSKNPTPIQTLLVGDNRQVIELQKKLSDQGVAVAAIRPPTVPVNTARLRISLSCEHTETQILQLLDLLAEYCIGDYQSPN